MGLRLGDYGCDRGGRESFRRGMFGFLSEKTKIGIDEVSKRKLDFGCVLVVFGRVFGEWFFGLNFFIFRFMCLYKIDVNFNLYKLIM